ncbi:EAL domain-containing protein [Neiella marina]|uniref:EAL domain-containing protein n=1 Tax=Neiella holothuriorum TaxID=2870530 RepID=A0ABS7EIJ7_9GAMM|nr:EAL domain-containing protein [Neiella holothuriorum]MBW8192105.1 EAL domain-containing protein [Neiella holothuriorum]
MQSKSCHIESIEQLLDWLPQVSAHLPAHHSALLIQLFAYDYADNALAYAQLLHEHWPDAHIIGASSQQSLAEGEAQEHGITVVVSCFEHTTLKVAFHELDDDIASVGQQLAQQLITPDTKALILFADDAAYNDEAFWHGLSSPDQQLIIAGGQAAPIPSGSWVLLNDQIHHQAAVAVSLCSEQLTAVNNAFSEWFPIGRAHAAGFSQGERLYRIGERTAYEQYCHYLNGGQPVSLEAIADFPLMSDEHRSHKIIKPTLIHDDGSISFSEGITEGESVWFVYSHPSLTEQHKQDNIRQLTNYQPQSIFIYNCASRAQLAFGDTSELTPFAAIASTAGFYCHGEFSGIQRPQSHHHTLTYLALSESPQAQPEQAQSYDQHSSLTHLFYMIRRSLGDLETMTVNLEQQVENKNQQLLASLKIDALTGLPNHMALQASCEVLQDITHAVAIRLTNLAAINEFYSHHIGDIALRKVSEELQRWVADYPQTGQLYSTGPSEWVITLHKVSDDMTASLARSIEYLIEELESEPLNVEHEINGVMLNLTLTAGVADYLDIKQQGGKGHDLVLKAQEARRRAMQRNTVVCTADELYRSNNKVEHHINALCIVNKALSAEQVCIFGQPIFHAGSRQQASTECLVRINNKGRIISPGEFLSAIQDTHLYSRLSRQIIEQACQLMDATGQRYSINLAPQDLQNDHTMQLLLQRIGQLKNPTALGIEIVETEAIEDYLHLKNICSALRRLGTRLIIDDFGSGYSNIDEILMLEPDVIKFDGSLIRNIDRNQRQRLIVSNMAKLFADMNIKTVAEFVHSEAVCNVVEELGVDYLQGFYLGQPQPL